MSDFIPPSDSLEEKELQNNFKAPTDAVEFVKKKKDVVKTAGATSGKKADTESKSENTSSDSPKYEAAVDTKTSTMGPENYKEPIIEESEIDLPELEPVEELKLDVDSFPKPEIKSIIPYLATNSSEVKSSFEKDFGLKFNEIEQDLKLEVAVADENYQDNIDRSFPDGVDQYEKVNDKGEKYLMFPDLGSQSKYQAANNLYKEELEKVKLKQEDENEYIKKYNFFVGNEAQAIGDKALKDRQNRIKLDNKIYLKYKDGSFTGETFNYDDIEDVYVNSDRLSFDEWKNIEGNKNKTKEEFQTTIHVLPKYDSVDEYVKAYEKGYKTSYLQEGSLTNKASQNVANFLGEEYVVETKSDKSYSNKKNRTNYFTGLIGGKESQPIFTDYSADQAIPVLQEYLPTGYKIDKTGAGGILGDLKFGESVKITNIETGAELEVNILNKKDKTKAQEETLKLIDWLAENSNTKIIEKSALNLDAVSEYVSGLESLDVKDGGLNVESLKDSKLENYGEYVDKFDPTAKNLPTKEFVVDNMSFADVVTPSYEKRATLGNITSTKIEESRKDVSDLRLAQQQSFNSYIQEKNIVGKDNAISGSVDYSTMPYKSISIVENTAINTSALKANGQLPSNDFEILKQTDVSALKNKLQGVVGSEEAINNSLENGEAIFTYIDKSGELKIFNTEEWSKENNGESFTTFINGRAATDILVPRDLLIEKRRAFENLIEIDKYEFDERKEQGKFLVKNIALRKKYNAKLNSLNYTEKSLNKDLSKFQYQDYYLEIINAVKNDPNYKVVLPPGEPLVEIDNNYGGKSVIPKSMVDNAVSQFNSFINISTALVENNNEKSKILDEVKDPNDAFEIYTKNYSDLESAAQNFALSTGDFVGSTLYGGYKYLTPIGWIASALQSKGIIEDPIQQLMQSYRAYGDYQRSFYNAPSEFGTFKNTREFGSWFFNMAGTQLPQFGAFMFSGGTAAIPMVIMGSSAAGSADLDFRQEVLLGDKNYDEFDILWRSTLSGISESVFGSLPTWKIMNKGKSLIKGIGGDATSTFKNGAISYLKSQAPEVVKDVGLDTGFEVINGVVQNVLGGRAPTTGLGEIAATSLFTSGPIAVVSPVYYALTTKDFIGGNIKQKINENSFKLSELKNTSKKYSNQILSLIDNSYTLSGAGKAENAKKIKELSLKIENNNSLSLNLDLEIKTDFKKVDELFKNKGIVPEGSKNFNLVLNDLIDLKVKAKEINNDKTISNEKKTIELDEINKSYVQLDQVKNQFLREDLYGSAFFALKGASILNPDQKAKYNSLMAQAKNDIIQNQDDNSVEPDITVVESKAEEIYYKELVETQIQKDLKANPNLLVARTEDEAINIIDNSLLGEQQKENMKLSILEGNQNGAYIRNDQGGKQFLAYTPNMVKNKKTNTGGHETSHDGSANLLKKDPKKFNDFTQQVIKYMEAADPELWTAIQLTGTNNLRDEKGEWDNEEVIASFIENIGSGKIKLNKNGNMPAYLGFLFNEGLNNASNGEYNIPFSGQNDIVQWFAGLGKALNDGDVTISKYNELLEDAVLGNQSTDVDNVIQLNPENSQSAPAVAASETIIKDSKQVGEQINDVVGDIDNVDDLSSKVYNNLLSPDAPPKTARIFDELIKKQLTANKVNVKNDGQGQASVYNVPLYGEDGFIQMVKEKLLDKSVFRFNENKAVVKEDGNFDVGGYLISELVKYRIGDVLNDIRPKIDVKSTDEVSSTGQSFDAVDPTAESDVTKGLDQKPIVAPRSNIKQAAPEFVTPELETEVETAVLEIIEGVKPEVDSKDFRPFIKEVLEGKLTSKVQKGLGIGKDYNFLIRKLAPKLKDIMPIDYFVKLESQSKPEDRIFTEPPVRLTKKADIDKAMLDDKVYVENIAQGVNIYKFKDFKPEQLSNYILAPAINPNTGQRSGLKGTRKTSTAASIASELGKDMIPSVMKKADKSVREVAEVSRKIQRDPTIKFSNSQQKQINDLNLAKNLKKTFVRRIGQIVDNNPGITLQEAINLEYNKIRTNKGFAYENVIIRILKQLKVKGFEVSDQAGGNKKGISDFAATLFGNALNIEVKLAVAQYGDVGLVFRNGLVDFNNNVKNKNYSFKERIRKELFDKADKALKAYRKRAGELGADLDVYDKTGKLPTEIYLQLGQGLDAEGVADLKPKYAAIKEKYPDGIKGEGLQKTITQIAEFDITPVREIYENKVPPTYYIQLKDSGLFFMGENPLGLPVPELTGNVDLTLRVNKGESKVNKDGVMMTTVNLRVLPSKLKNIPKSEYTLDSAISMEALLKTDAVQILKDKIPAKKYNIENESNTVVKYKSSESNADIINYAATVDEALRLANSLDQPVKKIRVFDFDDTLATTKSNVLITAPDGTESSLTAEKFALDGARLLEEGYSFDFSEFNKVTKGKPGPLLDLAKKIQAARGTEDVFVLTARNPEAQVAIKEFLDSQGLDIPLDNITGLGDSTGAAKAKWMINKAADGYNDFYFADDAYENVKAVRDAMSVIDVKSKVQQAIVKSSETLNSEFNDLLEQTTGVESLKRYSAARAKTIGASKGNFKFFIPYSAEDYLGLIYPTLAKGSKGDAQMAWYKTNILDKYTIAQESLSMSRINLMNDFKQLKKSLDVPKNLRKTNDSGFTNEQAVRVHLFTSMGYEVPGLSKRDLKQLNDTVENDSQLKTFSEQILSITKGDGYSLPKENWLAGTITTDLIDLINTEKRSKYLAPWQQAVDVVYSKENLNKLESLYGTKYRESLENILSRMKTGTNRTSSGSKIENQILDYVNGSIGTVMFFNTRSALLQTISSINFVNWSFNNPYKAGKAFANQPQYWKDFKELMNSDYLVDRRNGLKLNISESEIADAASTSKNKGKAALSWLLSKGFLPTQIADSFAIASGGATFYRNRIEDLMKQGKTETEAKKQAMIEFRQISEQSQQSSDPSKISSQQASNAGRIILAFANTPMQYARLQKRAIQDLVNGRGDAKSHVSRIVYYGFVQNVLFNALQQAVFALGFGEDEDNEDAKTKKAFNVANGMADSLLRGLGIGGQAVSVGKNFLMDIYERSGRDRPEYVDATWKLTQFSPPISSKISRIKQAAWQFDSKKRRDIMFEKGFALDNPAYEAGAKVISATTNVPLDRIVYKLKNIEGALNEDNEAWKRLAMLGGWPKWQLEPPKSYKPLTAEEKAEDKVNAKIDNYKNAKGSKDYDAIKKLTSDQQIKMLKSLGFGEYTIKNAKSEKDKIDLIIAKNSKKKNIVDKKAIEEYKYKKLNKAEQIRKLDSLGLSKDEIKALKKESDRVEKLVDLMK